MDTKKNIQNEVEAIINSGALIKASNVSPFFKDKTMQLLFTEKETKQSTLLSWFTPKVQLATLACVVILNVFAFTKIKETTYNDNVNQFAESYGLSTSTETFILN